MLMAMWHSGLDSDPGTGSEAAAALGSSPTRLANCPQSCCLTDSCSIAQSLYGCLTPDMINHCLVFIQSALSVSQRLNNIIIIKTLSSSWWARYVRSVSQRLWLANCCSSLPDYIGCSMCNVTSCAAMTVVLCTVASLCWRSKKLHLASSMPTWRTCLLLAKLNMPATMNKLKHDSLCVHAVLHVTAMANIWDTVRWLQVGCTADYSQVD